MDSLGVLSDDNGGKEWTMDGMLISLETTEEVEQSTQEEAAQPEVTLEKVLSA